MLKEAQEEFRVFLLATGAFSASSENKRRFTREYLWARTKGRSVAWSREYAGLYTYSRGEGEGPTSARKRAIKYANTEDVLSIRR